MSDKTQTDAELSDDQLEEAAGGCFAPYPDPIKGPKVPTLPPIFDLPGPIVVLQEGTL